MYELLVLEFSRTVFMIKDNPDWGDNLGEEPLYFLIQCLLSITEHSSREQGDWTDVEDSARHQPPPL